MLSAFIRFERLLPISCCSLKPSSCCGFGKGIAFAQSLDWTRDCQQAKMSTSLEPKYAMITIYDDYMVLASQNNTYS